MKTVVDLAVQTLGPVLFVLLLAGAILGIVIGALLVFDSARVMRWNSALNRWYSTRKATQVLERPVEVKRLVYRWHRVVGVLVFAGSLYTLDILVFGFNTGALVRIFRDVGNPAILSLVVETVKIFLIVGNIAALLAAAVLVFRPSLLKGLEAWGDRYYSGREATEALDVMRYQPDEFVQARPKTVGALVTLSSLYVLATLGMVLLH
jgi:hypothetical protein